MHFFFLSQPWPYVHHLSGQSVGKGNRGCALKPQFSQDTTAAEEAVAEYLIKPTKWNASFEKRGNILFWLEAVAVHWKCPYGRLAAIDKGWYSLQKANDSFPIQFSIDEISPLSHRGNNKQFW